MSKPKGVANAVLIVWLSIAASAFMALFDRLLGYKSAGEMSLELLLYALFCIIPYKLGNRSNAARYVYAVTIALSVFLYLGGAAGSMSPVERIGSLILIPFEALSIYWLFCAASSAWYAGRSENADSAELPLSQRREPTIRL